MTRTWARPQALARPVVAALTLVGLPVVAQAHEASGQAAGFLSGLAHPVSGLDHVLAMVAVGLWGAQLRVPSIWLLPVLFPLVLAFDGLLVLLCKPLPGVKLGIAASATVLGAFGVHFLWRALA